MVFVIQIYYSSELVYQKIFLFKFSLYNSQNFGAVIILRLVLCPDVRYQVT